MTVAEQYPPVTGSNGLTWYRPAYTGAVPQMWGWTSDPQQAHASYLADPPRPTNHRKDNSQ